jgi:hypothetical protein
VPLQELSSITDSDERAAAEKRVKSRTLGTVRLIAELYRKEVVREAIIIVCLRELLEVRDSVLSITINQLHVFLAREEPKKGATPKPPLVVPNR